MVRTARKSINYEIPQNVAECEKMIADLGRLQRDIAQITLDRDNNIAKAKEAYSDHALPLQKQIHDLENGIHDYCNTNRAKLTNGGRKKNHVFNNGLIGWRIKPPKVTLKKMDAVIEALKAARLTKFIRTKLEVDKDEILKNPEAVSNIKGISVGSEGEDFYIEPNEVPMK